VANYWKNIVEATNNKDSFWSTQKALISALDTFARRPAHVTSQAPHIRDATDLKRVMVIVVFSLLPALLFGIWNTGKNTYMSIGVANCSFMEAFLEGSIHVLPLVLISYGVGGLCETIFAQMRNHDIAEGFLVTGLLYPLVCPPTIPWWMFVCGIVFGVIIGKELFGGTGMNIINPALFSRAFLFFSYPAAMSGDEVWIKKPFYETMTGEIKPVLWTTIDTNRILSFLNNSDVNLVSGQTPLALATYKANLNMGSDINTHVNQVYSKWDLFLGNIPGSIGETSTLMCVIGAAILITTNVGAWRIMFGCFLGAGITTYLLNIISTNASLLNISFSNHICMGGFCFGAVFMATDPVSGPLHKLSKIIYGFMIGALCILIRTINPAFPEGMMMSILFMNIFSPLIDHYVTEWKIAKYKEKYHAR
jgi:Na+-transporting NADH:ubiquinone oxidoreductase subunit B